VRALILAFAVAATMSFSARAQDIVIGAGLVISGPFAFYGTDAKAVMGAKL
jgi:hypothetical protein